MYDLNKVLLTGRLTRDVELKSLTNGKCVGSVGLASNRKFGDKEETTFVDLEIWDKGAEILAEYGKKGKQVLIEGRLKLDKWETDGNKFSKLFVVVEEFKLLGSKDE